LCRVCLASECGFEKYRVKQVIRMLPGIFMLGRLTARGKVLLFSRKERHCRFLVAMLLGMTAQVDVVASQTLPQPVSEALQRAGVPLDAVALVVRDAGGKDTLVSHNATKSMNPASVIKLVTTAAALDLLGPAYVFKTEFYARGEVRNGVLDGDLYVKGYGDPKLTYERLWAAIRQLRERGVRDVRGDLVFDRSYFAPVVHDSSKFDGKALRAYNVGPDALLFNYKAVAFLFIPENGAISISAEPAIPGVEIASRVKLVNGACGDWQERLAPEIEENGLLATVQFSGSFAESCGEKAWNLSLFDHPRYNAALFRTLWSEAGGRIFGKTRDAGVPSDARLIFSIDSPPLADVVRDINKFSNNVMARQLFLTLSAEATGQPGETARSVEVIKAWLKHKGIEAPELVLENGAGLSRVERISANTLAALLQVMSGSALMPELISSLPLVAVDGTMKKRMNGNGVAGQAHIKGGTLNEVRAIAGDVVDRNGKRWLVVFMVNHPNAPAAQTVQDILLQWIYAQDGPAHCRNCPMKGGKS
jgi:D-alanyl-D-alanine carboxypeptidase/D-alanyl-D-alanine-endopeptidase (penicillin-binding protein 4)